MPCTTAQRWAIGVTALAGMMVKRSKALGVFTGVTGLAVPVGPLLGGAVVTGISWPWIFWINIPVAAVLIPLAWTRVEESFGPKAKLDLGGLG